MEHWYVFRCRSYFSINERQIYLRIKNRRRNQNPLSLRFRNWHIQNGAKHSVKNKRFINISKDILKNISEEAMDKMVSMNGV